MKRPNKSELIDYMHDIKGAALRWGVNERTIRRWLALEDLYNPRDGYGPGKLDKEKAAQIRRLSSTGYTQSQLGTIFNVSQAMVGRVVNNIAHPVNMRLKGTAEVKYSPARRY